MIEHGDGRWRRFLVVVDKRTAASGLVGDETDELWTITTLSLLRVSIQASNYLSARFLDFLSSKLLDLMDIFRTNSQPNTSWSEASDWQKMRVAGPIMSNSRAVVELHVKQQTRRRSKRSQWNKILSTENNSIISKKENDIGL